MLAPDDVATLAAGAAEIIDRGTECPVVLMCEHASHTIPAPWGDLGVPAEALQDHIGWDIGAGDLTRGLSKRLNATAILAGYSRLFFDCNRYPDQSDAIPETSDNIDIPGNRQIAPDQRRLRQIIAFDPFHAAISSVLNRAHAAGTPLLIGIHSFSPVLNGFVRPWHAGVIWDECDAFADAVLRRLKLAADGSMNIGENQPYSSKNFRTYSLSEHGKKRGIENIVIEVRNDELRSPSGVKRWETIIADAIVGIAG